MSDDLVALWNHWNELGGPKYPLDHAVRFCFRRFAPERRRGARALDLGCGSGVHTAFLAREGFVVTGVDISTVAIANTRRKLADEGLAADLRVGSADAIDFPPGSFDLVLSIGVLESAGVEIARGAVPKALRALAAGGSAFFVFASDRDDRTRGENEYGIHGFTRAEVDAVFDVPAAKIEIDRCVTTYGGGAVEQNHWLISVTA